MAMFSGSLPPPGSRALILARYSSNLQNPLSADDQIRVCREDCERHGWEVVGVFKDEAKSGRSTANRAGYLDMMAAAEAGEVDVICVFHLDRLGRNARELHDAKNRLQDVNAVIHTHDRGVMSGLEFAMYAELAQMESEKIADRTSRGRIAAAKRGQIMGDIPYGYRAVAADQPGGAVVKGRGRPARRIEIDPETAPIVLRINLDYDAGRSPHQIAAALTAEGVPTPQGKRIWSHNTILGTRRSMSGMLRNPIYIGKVIHGKVKTAYDHRTGKVAKRKNDRAEMIEWDAPWLQIVPHEVWDRTQAKLADRPPSTLQGRRRPSYLFSGLTKCAVCNGPYVQISTKMGCSGRKMGTCSNERRIWREDLEAAVLEGLTARVAQPQVLKWFIPEYLREIGPAKTERGERYERSKRRLEEVTREIDNLMAQIRSGAAGYAAGLLNENLNTLGAEKDKLEREVRAGPPQEPAALTTEALLSKAQSLLTNLGAALQGDERDAARARDIIRSLITRITVEPLEREGERPSARKSGAVRVHVEGEVSRLVDHAMLDRKITSVRSTGDMHDLPVATFQFYVDLDRKLPEEERGVWANAAVVGRMLDDAEWPILFQEMVEALRNRAGVPIARDQVEAETRARIAIAQFRRDGWAKAVRLGNTHGWVWSDRGLSDEDWRRRFDASREERPIRGAVGEPLRVIRVQAPEAAVVVIQPGDSADAGVANPDAGG